MKFLRYALALVLPLLTSAAESERPNILWLTSEDNGTFLGAYGDPLAHTPALDELARKGVLYERCFAQPVCAPSRFALITGLHAVSSGPAHHMRANGKLPAGVSGFPALLRNHGYYTANDSKTDYNAPIDLERCWNETKPGAHWRNRSGFDQPFFSVINHTITHESCLFPDAELPLTFPSMDPARVRIPPYQPDTAEMRADWVRYYNHMRLLDEQVGARLRELEEAGLADDTIVFYYADNGGVLPRSKRFLQRSGIHVPLIVYFPPKWQHLAPAAPGTRVSEPVSFVDFAPTVLSLAGVKIPGYMQGRAFAGRAGAPATETVFITRDRMDERYDMMRAVASSRWIYIRNFRPDLPYVQPLQYMFRARGYQSWARLAAEGKLTRETAQFWGEKPAEELYDIAEDPDNIVNLAESSEHRAVLQKMRAALRRQVVEIKDNGFLPEGSPLEGYEASRVAPGWPVDESFDMAVLASERNGSNLPQLIEGLGHGSEAVRWWAAQGCAMLGEQAQPAAAVLRSRLNDVSGAVTVAAAEALARQGGIEEALPVLRRALENTDSPWFALQAANVLDRLGEQVRPILPAMRAVLSDCEIKAATATSASNPFRYLRDLLAHTISRLKP